MKTLNDLHSRAEELEFWIGKDLEALKRHRAVMLKEKDISKIRDISGTLDNLGYDLSRYKKWAGQEAEELEK